MALSRRRFLAVGGGLAAAGGLALVAEPRLRIRAEDLAREQGRRLTEHGPADGINLTSGSFRSRMRAGVETGWALAVPASASGPLPLVVALHGRSGDHRSAFHSLDLDRALAEAVRTGSKPFALAAVDGGDHSYYHRRRDGSDVGAMIVEELPEELRSHADLNGTLGLTGWSMGGYGALHLAQLYGPSRIKAVAANSAALWDRWQDSAPGAFDGPSDFAANSVLDRLDELRAPTRLVCGGQDPFIATNRELVKRKPSVEHAFPDGRHTNVFWRSTSLGQIRFLAAALA